MTAPPPLAQLSKAQELAGSGAHRAAAPRRELVGLTIIQIREQVGAPNQFNELAAPGLKSSYSIQ